MRFLIILTAALVLAGSASASAQFLQDFEERLWGVQVSLTPEWRSVEQGGKILDFDRFDLSGSDF